LSLEDDLLEQRVKRTTEIEALGFRAYGQRFDFTHTIPEILAAESAKTAEELAAAKPHVRIAGRIQTMRRMGKAGFFHLLQRGERLQIFNNRSLEKLFQDFQSVKFFLTRDRLREVIVRR
jgi:lysyl-tRNA synthetase class 2